MHVFIDTHVHVLVLHVGACTFGILDVLNIINTIILTTMHPDPISCYHSVIARGMTINHFHMHVHCTCTLYMYIQMYMYIYIQMYMYIYIQMYMYIYIQMYICVYGRVTCIVFFLSLSLFRLMRASSC